MKPYILLTPGPLTTTETVKEAMMTDWCTWDEDYNVHIVEEIRNSLVALSSRHPDEYTSILLQGSGTYCVEAVIGSTIKPGDKLLILSNGAYGDRMGNIAEYHGIDYDLLAFDETEQISVSYVDDYLAHNADITHVAIVHCETTTGILNPLKDMIRRYFARRAASRLRCLRARSSTAPSSDSRANVPAAANIV